VPIEQPQVIAMMPGNINVPAANGLFVTVNVQSDGTPEGLAAIPGAVQEIVDMFQEWSGKFPGTNVTGQVYGTELSAVTPTNPEVDTAEPPVEDPDPSDLTGSEEPATV
jgi:hypothetical protein